MLLSSDALAVLTADLFEHTPGNRVPVEGEDRVLTIFGTPLIGTADADDPLFESFRHPSVIGPTYMPPREWLPSARSVLSFAFPYTAAVRESNRRPGETATSVEWQYGRFEGEAFLLAFARALQSALAKRGIVSVIPGTDPRFAVTPRLREIDGRRSLHMESRWSERHAAYAAGLGTFGLSRGLITGRGVAVRFVSLVTDGETPAAGRKYGRWDEWCTRCGACIARCPVDAISLEYGKDNILCKQWVDETRVRYAPRYGCGKCQTGVPCETQIPTRRQKA